MSQRRVIQSLCEKLESLGMWDENCKADLVTETSTSNFQCTNLLNRIKQWLLENTTLDKEMQMHQAYNFYLTILGFRPAFLIASGIDAEKFAQTFGLISKKGGYFDIPGTNFSYVINTKEWSRVEPLFDSLDKSYTDDEDEMEARYKDRVKLIGQILGFGECIGDSPGSSTYLVGINVMPIGKMNEKTEVFMYLCSEENINTSLFSALNLIKNATPHFEPCGLMLGFEINYPYK